ncbi:lecithin retinol acyltransferase family protein [Thalassospiraceae bacterium LMO-JJ14]|nr:lecithin retinol acyltransferase family protein [Thalassospiraceae bacterium LMO-JJ14]
MAINEIEIGSRVWVNLFPIRHHGRYLGNGMVAHNSKKNRCVSIEPLDAFSDGRKVYHSPPSTPIDVANMWAFAESLVGKPYSLTGFNCEHFANYLVDGVAKSKQAKYGATGACLGAVIAMSKNGGTREVLLLAGVLGIGGLLLAHATD